MKKLLLSVAVIASIAATAQKDPAKKFAETITAKDLKSKLTVIAGPGMEGRETATEGQRKAATFIENHFKKLGLQPGAGTGYQMEYPVYQDSLQSVSFSVNGTTFSPDKDFTISGSSFATIDRSAKDVVFASLGIVDSTTNDYDGLNISKKWVMLIDGTRADLDKTPDAESRASLRALYAKVALAKKNGARGVIIISNDFPKKEAFSRLGNMQLKQTADSSVIPVVYASAQVASAILGKQVSTLKDLAKAVRGVYPAIINLNAIRFTKTLHSTNVLGVLPGTDKKDEYVFVTGHYDHLGKKGDIIYYGADDDGSGTTSVLQIAEAFAKAKAKGISPKRTIVFMTVSGEEKGLWGSEYYSEHPAFPLDKTSVDLNIDMVGRIDPDRKEGDSTNYVYTIGEDKLSSELFGISDSINKKYMNMELDRRFNDPNDPNKFYYRSDHFNFAKKGVPVIFYFNGVHADYHRPTDTVDKINFNVMEKRVRLVFYTAWEMANRENMLKRDIPLK